MGLAIMLSLDGAQMGSGASNAIARTLAVLVVILGKLNDYDVVVQAVKERFFLGFRVGDRNGHHI